MNFKKITTWAFASILAFNISCRNDDAPQAVQGAYDNGFLVANEGNYGRPNASVSFISNDLSKVENNIYSTNNNNEQLGDVLQSITFWGSDAYVVANNSNKIVIANRYTMKKKAEITSNLVQPRYVAFANNHTYVTNNRSVSVYNTINNNFVKNIPLGAAAEKIFEVNGNIFVQNAVYGTGNKVSYITTSDNALSKTITLSEGQIQDMSREGTNLYALASTKDASYIYQISSSGEVTRTINLTKIAGANKFAIENGVFYFANVNGLYAMPINSNAIPTKPIIDKGVARWDSYYGFNVIDGKIFVSNANLFTADSKVSVYTTTGTLLKEFTTGMGTNGFYKN